MEHGTTVDFDERGTEEVTPAVKRVTNLSQRRALDVADDMVLEYLAFRGFTETFRNLSLERLDDGRHRGTFDAGVAVEALLRPVRELDGGRLIEAWEFFETKFFSHLDAELSAHADALRCGIFRYFCVVAISCREHRKATELLAELARRDADDARGRGRPQLPELDDDDDEDPNDVAVWAIDDIIGKSTTDARGRNGRRWREWFALPHLPEPQKDPVFQIYFTRRWQDDLVFALKNFLAAVFARAPPPKLLLLEKWHRASAQRNVRAALDEAHKNQQHLKTNLLQARSSRDKLATTVKNLLSHCHHENLRDSRRLQRGSGLFDEDPNDALRSTRDAGAAALEIARRLDSTSGHHRDADLLALCDASSAYLSFLRGTNVSPE